MFSSWYIHELFKHFRKYLRHCSQCQIFQTRRYKFYESLQSIFTSKISFHILTMNFVLALSIFHSDKFDSTMFITCKFFKRMTIISDKTVWKVRDWILKLLNQLKIMNWELFKTIISNKDVKFLSKLWKIWFNKFDVRLLYFIVYHSQSNDQFERTNQTIEIAFRYHLIDMKNSKKWSQCLLYNFNLITSLSKLKESLTRSYTNLSLYNEQTWSHLMTWSIQFKFAKKWQTSWHKRNYRWSDITIASINH